MSKIKHFFRGRRWLRNLITILLCLVVVGGVVGGVVALTRNTDKIEDALTYKSYGWTHYRVGGLDGSGKYMSTDQSVYTKEAFLCQGLNVELDFDSDVSYQIYFYDQNNEFVHTTGRLTGTFEQESIPFFAKYARIVVTPNDDNKVTIFEIQKYASQLNTKIYREQGFKNYTENLFTDWSVGYKFNTSGEKVAISGSDNVNSATSNFVNVSSYSEGLLFKDAPNSSYAGAVIVMFYDASHTYIASSGTRVDALSTMAFTSSEGVNYYKLDISAFPVGANYVAVCWANGEPRPQLFCR